MDRKQLCSAGAGDNSPAVYGHRIDSIRSPRFWLCIIATLLLTGCGSDRVPIGGTVTFDGKPLSEGSISFDPVDGIGPTTGGTITDGKYELVGNAAPLPGKKTVRISGAFKTGRRIPAGPPLPPGTMVDEIGARVPDAYGNQSTLTCEVSRNGSKQIDFNLKSQ